MSVKNRTVWTEVEPALTSGDFDKARELTGKTIRSFPGCERRPCHAGRSATSR